MFVPSVSRPEDASSLIEQQVVFGRPSVRVDAVQDVSGVVVDSAECADHSETLVACRLDAAHALVERSLDQHSTRLTQRYYRQRPQVAVVCAQGRQAKIFETKAVTSNLFWGFPVPSIPFHSFSFPSLHLPTSRLFEVAP